MSRYSQDFRDRVIDAVVSSNEPISRVALRFDVAKCTVYSWVQAYRFHQESGIINSMNINNDAVQGSESDEGGVKPPDYEKLYLQLLRRNEQLEGEVEFLKKVSRYFVQDSPQRRK